MADVDDVLEQSADRGRPDAGLSEEAVIERHVEPASER
jgi:hypothetical protein